VIDHGDLVVAVSRRADVDADAAREAISVVIGEIARHLLNESRERLATVFPDAARYAATTLGEVEAPDGEEIIRDVAGQLDTTPDRARDLTRSVLAAIDEAEPGLVDLPSALRETLLT
jgi:hypothetical protein